MPVFVSHTQLRLRPDAVVFARLVPSRQLTPPLTQYAPSPIGPWVLAVLNTSLASVLSSEGEDDSPAHPWGNSAPRTHSGMEDTR